MEDIKSIAVLPVLTTRLTASWHSLWKRLASSCSVAMVLSLPPALPMGMGGLLRSRLSRLLE